MPTADAEQIIRTLDICKQSQIAAPIELVFASVLEELGPGSQLPDGQPFPMKIEPWPGGRLFRDLGNNTGHFWAHIQVIKPPTLLELCGPLFMSYPAVSHVQYRLAPEGRGTLLKLTHKAMGQITDEHLEGVSTGWNHGLQRIREIAELKARESARHG